MYTKLHTLFCSSPSSKSSATFIVHTYISNALPCNFIRRYTVYLNKNSTPPLKNNAKGSLLIRILIRIRNTVQKREETPRCLHRGVGKSSMPSLKTVSGTLETFHKRLLPFDCGSLAAEVIFSSFQGSDSEWMGNPVLQWTPAQYTAVGECKVSISYNN